MSWHNDALANPVLVWEMKRASRRKLSRGLLFVYAAWLVLQAAFLITVAPSTYTLTSKEWPRPGVNMPTFLRTHLEYHRFLITQQIEFRDSYVVTVLSIQLVLVMGIVPFLTAGALALEKESGTLFELFGTQLTSQQILLGKLLGRLLVLVPMMSISVPPLVLVATLGSGELAAPLFLALVQQVIAAFVLGAFCLLFAIWIRRAADAIILAYVMLALAYLLVRGVGAWWLDPVSNLQGVLHGEPAGQFVLHLVLWAGVGTLCLRLGWGRLRKVCVEDRDRSLPRRLWAGRPAVGDDPIRWRECYVIGLAPLRMLRLVPRRLALLGVFSFSSAFVLLIAESHAPGLAAALSQLDLVLAQHIIVNPASEMGVAIPMMGLVFILLASLVLGVRCGISVAEEKRRNTWDDLLLTANSFREITTGKMWGILQATLPYVVAYALPVLLIAALAGPKVLMLAGMWIVLPCVIVLSAALMGIDMVHVPLDMDERQQGGAFSFENEQGQTGGPE